MSGEPTTPAPAPGTTGHSFLLCKGPHDWREKRYGTGTKADGPPWFFFSKCQRCVAILQTTVTTGNGQNGDVYPKVRSYIILPNKTIDVPPADGVPPF